MATYEYNRLGIADGLSTRARRRAMFTGANQGPGATTTTVALATTYTGLVLSNPAASGKDLLLEEVGVNVLVNGTAASQIGLLAGYVAAGLVTHTTALDVYSNILGIDGDSTHAVSIAKIDAAATLPSTPFLYRTFFSVPIVGTEAATAAQPLEPNSGMTIWKADGQLVIEPGGYVAIYTSTVVTIQAHMTWTEITA